MMKSTIDRANAEFWSEVCGSGLARSLGITDHSKESLARFDEAYLAYYPYLLDRIGYRGIAGKSVLEVGLGYGTVSQKLAEVAGRYTGLDIAPSPVAMVNHRLHIHDLQGHAVRGSILQAPIPTGSQDVVVAIGCFHHTGDVQRAIDETHRVLRPGGTAFVMVYNGLSYRQWCNWPRQTFALARAGESSGSYAQRKAYDASLEGEAAPETAFLSRGKLRSMFGHFSSFECAMENCDELPFGAQRVVPRRLALAVVGRLAGLDLYVRARK